MALYVCHALLKERTTLEILFMRTQYLEGKKFSLHLKCNTRTALFINCKDEKG